MTVITTFSSYISILGSFIHLFSIFRLLILSLKLFVVLTLFIMSIIVDSESLGVKCRSTSDFGMRRLNLAKYLRVKISGIVSFSNVFNVVFAALLQILLFAISAVHKLIISKVNKSFFVKQSLVNYQQFQRNFSWGQLQDFKYQIQIITDKKYKMEALHKFNLRIRNQNLHPVSINLDGSFSDRTQNNLKFKPKPSKMNSLVFHKRNNTAISDLTDIAQQYEPFSSNQLKQQLEKKQKYLQSLIQQIVQSEQAHKIEMNSIDEKYEAQIQQLHQQLQNLVQKNRMLRNTIDEKEKKVLQKRNRSPRISNQTLLLDYEQVSGFDIQ